MPVSREMWAGGTGADASGGSDPMAAPQSVSTPASSAAAGASSAAAASKKREAEEQQAAEEAKKMKAMVQDGGESAASMRQAGTGAVWGTARNPVYMQQMEDEKLAAGLVQAAGSRAVLSQGMGQTAQQRAGTENNPSSMSPRERSILQECREHVHAHGGPDIEALGWMCKIGVVEGSGGTVEANFISPQVLTCSKRIAQAPAPACASPC